MVTINVEYQGDLRCRSTHGPSGTTLITDAPADNFGKAESFSPTDLVATALGTCLLTVMGIKAGPLGIDLTGSTVTVDKQMTTAPRRIGRLAAIIHIPCNVSDRDRKLLEAAALTCPVHETIAPNVEMPITFNWGSTIPDPR